MTYDRIIFSKLQPNRTDVVWAKPVPGGFGLYLYFAGKWQPQRIMNDEKTINPDDDQPYDLDAVGASKLSELEDVSLDSASNGQILKYNGATWENVDDDTTTPGLDTVGTNQIIDNSVMIKDLNDEVKDKLEHTYDDDSESLYIDGAKPEEE